MTALSHSRAARWAAGDGPLNAPGGASVGEADALAAMPEVGLHELEVGGERFEVERVGSRYCTVADLRAYGSANNDGFEDPSAYPDDAVLAAIQAAEEAIEAGCGRSFCERACEARVAGTSAPQWLPVEDARSVSAGTQLYGNMVIADGEGTVRVVYGARADETIRQACMKLAASYLRPRAGAENARGTSQDGVYISYELATGGEGSWTGIPYVDAAIESHRSRRAVIL